MINASGIDISKWDVAALQFALYGAARSFIMIKVSEGIVEDPLFRAQWPAGTGKTRRAPYHFWRSFVNQKQAVAKFLQLLGNDPGELPAMLDLEAADGSDQVMALAHVWVDEYQRLTGLWPIIYSSRNFLHANGADYQTMWDRFYGRYHNDWLKKCLLMLAEWPFDEIKSMPGYPQLGNELRAVLIQEVIDGKRLLPWPKAPAPWMQVEYWQWTSRFPPEQVPGYFLGANHKLAVDAIFHRLSRETYEAAYPLPGGSEPPPIEPPATLQSLTIHVRSDKAELIWAKADDKDVTSITVLETEPFPVPPPIEPPKPPDGDLSQPPDPRSLSLPSNIWTVSTLEEYYAAGMGDEVKWDGSFCAIGGHGQTNAVLLSKREINLILTIPDNQALWPAWAVGTGAGRVYIKPDNVDDPSTVLWPVILNASAVGKQRNLVRVLDQVDNGQKVMGKPIPAVLVEGIKQQSIYTTSPLVEPWLWSWCWTANRNGSYGVSHTTKDGIDRMFIAPRFDPRGGFEIIAGTYAFWVPRACIHAKLS